MLDLYSCGLCNTGPTGSHACRPLKPGEIDRVQELLSDLHESFQVSIHAIPCLMHIWYMFHALQKPCLFHSSR